MFSMALSVAPRRASREGPHPTARSAGAVKDAERPPGRGAPSPPATACAPAHVLDGAEHRATLTKPERETTRPLRPRLRLRLRPRLRLRLRVRLRKDSSSFARSAGRACHGARAVQGRLRRRCCATALRGLTAAPWP